jgi:hypothetical protein
MLAASPFCAAPGKHICAHYINMTIYFSSIPTVSWQPQPLVAVPISVSICGSCVYGTPQMSIGLFRLCSALPTNCFVGSIHHRGCGMVRCLLAPVQLRSVVFFGSLALAMFSVRLLCVWSSLLACLLFGFRRRQFPCRIFLCNTDCGTISVAGDLG